MICGLHMCTQLLVLMSIIPTICNFVSWVCQQYVLGFQGLFTLQRWLWLWQPQLRLFSPWIWLLGWANSIQISTKKHVPHYSDKGTKIATKSPYIFVGRGKQQSFCKTVHFRRPSFNKTILCSTSLEWLFYNLEKPNSSQSYYLHL